MIMGGKSELLTGAILGAFGGLVIYEALRAALYFRVRTGSGIFPAVDRHWDCSVLLLHALCLFLPYRSRSLNQ